MFKTNGRHSLHLVRYAAISIAVLLAFSWIVGFFQHATTPAPAPAPAHAPASAPAQAQPQAGPARAATMALPAGPVILPAQPAPAGLLPRHAEIALATAVNQTGPWTDLGSAIARAPTASLSTVAPAALAAVAPSSGAVRYTYRAWINAPQPGTYTVAASISGAAANVSLRVDGLADPVLHAARDCGLWGECPTTATTGAGSVALAAGWHEIDATVSTYAGATADVTLYMRAPGSSAPAVLVPAWPSASAAAAGAAP